MTSDRKKPGVAFWATVVVVVVVLYVLSVGPLTWLSSHGLVPDTLVKPLDVLYSPISWLYWDGPLPLPIKNALKWYADLWK